MTVDRSSCVTCGDSAFVATVVDLQGQTAVVDVDGRLEHVGTELVAPVSRGDRLLCHAGIALERLEDP